ncbi:MAG: epoxyqueuosine reductase [Clostridiales bacterium]|nr:epoxyqueuosine reductase [Clostridiales bacterium]
MLEREIEEVLKRGGASLVGFCDLGKSPIKNQEGLRYAVSIAYKLSNAVLKTIEERPTLSYFQHYRAVNARLDSLVLDVIRLIENEGYNAFPIAASQSTNDDKSAYRGVFAHKTAACLSGIGYIGKNALLLTEEYGSKVRLATVLTDMPLERQREIIVKGCGDCDICKKACPAGAISGKNFEVGMAREDFFDAEKCSNNMKTYKDIGRGAVCGLCIKACPKNKLF